MSGFKTTLFRMINKADEVVIDDETMSKFETLWKDDKTYRGLAGHSFSYLFVDQGIEIYDGSTRIVPHGWDRPVTITFYITRLVTAEDV